jgi:hypothetical protein
MNLISRLLCKRLLPRLIARACDTVIPRSGKQGEQVNCFVVSVDNNGKPYLMVTGLEGEDLHCLEWDGNHYSRATIISLGKINQSELFIAHYYGLSTVKYYGVYSLALSRITCWPYIKIYLVRVAEYFGQYFFNKKKLVTKQRIDLLRFLLSQHLEGHTSVDSFHLMSDLYTMKWVLHPDGEAQRHKVAFYLDALVTTGELRKRANAGYALTGHALKTIEEYEEQERRHTENVKIQRRMFWLTVAIVLLTLVQAGLVKLRPLIDLTQPGAIP